MTYKAYPIMGLLDEQGRLLALLCNGRSIPLTELVTGGGGDTTIPFLQSAIVAAGSPAVVTLTYSEAMSQILVGSITVGGASRAVLAQAVSGNTVRLDVSAPYVFGDSITVSVPAGCVRDIVGNPAIQVSNFLVTNNVPQPVDSTAPVFSSAAVNAGAASKIVVTFTETLSPTFTGSVTLGGPSRTATSVDVVGATVEITVSAPYAQGDAPTITYPAGWVRDAAGNGVLPQTARAVTNNVVAPGTIAQTFDGLYTGGWVPNSGTDAKTQPALTFPAKTANVLTGGYREPVYDTEMRIITAAVDVGTTGNDAAVHDYSNQQAFNANSTRFNIQSRNGFHYVFDAATNAKLDMGGVNAQGPGAIPGMAGNCEPQWHPTDPNIMTYTANGGGMIRYQFNVATKTGGVLFDLTTLVRAQSGMSTAGKAWMAGEGRPSDDWDRWAFLVTTASDGCLGMVVYQRSTNSILRSWLFSSTPNWVSISPSGLYVISSWYGASAGQVYPASMAAETARSLNSKGGANVFKVSDGTHQALSMIGEHSDIAWDYDGKEVYLSVSFSPGDGFTADGCVYTRRLEDPTFQTEFPVRVSGGTTGTQLHFSGRAINRKGWGLFNKSPGVGSGAWDGTVGAIELVPASLNPKIYRLFQHRSAGGDQFASPCATVNNDFTRVIAHTQDAAGNDVDLCCVLPSFALPVAGSRSPISQVAPSISGSASPGGTVTRALGTYGGLPVPTVSGNWQQSPNGSTGWVNISGQTSATYVVGVSSGVYIRWSETATNGTSPDASQVSNVLLVAALAAPVNTVAPTAPSTGDTSTAVTGTQGTWTGNPTPTYAYVWQRDISTVWTDSAFTTLVATLTPAGSWRIKVTATNSQGGVSANSAACTISAPAGEPAPSTTITFNQANGTTLETINAAWDGDTRYQVQSTALQNMGPFNAGYGLAYLTLAGGTNQAVQATMAISAEFSLSGDRTLNLHLHANATQSGYVAEADGTNIRLYRITDTSSPSAGSANQVAGPVAHGINTTTTAFTVKMTELNGRVRVYINGSGTALIDYTDVTKLTGGYGGIRFYPGGTESRIRVTDFRYGSS